MINPLIQNLDEKNDWLYPYHLLRDSWSIYETLWLDNKDSNSVITTLVVTMC